MLNYWTLPEGTISRVEAIVAVSYALEPDGRLTPPTRAVMDRAIEVWRAHPNAWLIASTGDNQRLGVTNARVMADYARAHGVAADRVLEEDRSSNTWQNLEESWRLAKGRGATRLTIVCYDLHARRCELTARRLGIPADIISATTSATGRAARKPWFASRATILLYEVGATLFGRLTGRL